MEISQRFVQKFLKKICKDFLHVCLEIRLEIFAQNPTRICLEMNQPWPKNFLNRDNNYNNEKKEFRSFSLIFQLFFHDIFKRISLKLIHNLFTSYFKNSPGIVLGNLSGTLPRVTQYILPIISYEWYLSRNFSSIPWRNYSYSFPKISRSTEVCVGFSKSFTPANDTTIVPVIPSIILQGFRPMFFFLQNSFWQFV